MTDRERTLAALRQNGERGITVRDFDPGPDGSVVDGGPAFTRLHARVCELRAEGYKITTVREKPFSKYVLRGFPPARDLPGPPERERPEVRAVAFRLDPFAIDTTEGPVTITLEVLQPGWTVTADGYRQTTTAERRAA